MHTNPKSVGRTLIPNHILKRKIEGMSDLERYELLITLRTKEKVSEEVGVLRWFFLRLIVFRAIMMRRMSFPRTTDWFNYGTEKYINGWNPSLAQYEETDRIADLVSLIVTYNAKSHLEAVRKALVAYYRRFGVLEVHGKLRSSGISFSFNGCSTPYTSTPGNTGELMLRGIYDYGRIYKYKPYQEYSLLVKLDSLLWRNKGDVGAAAEEWVLELQNNHMEFLAGKRKTKSLYPTRATHIACYNKLLKHQVATSVANAAPFSLMESHTELEESMNADEANSVEDWESVSLALPEILAAAEVFRDTSAVVRKRSFIYPPIQDNG